jgi:hypothetical protein
MVSGGIDSATLWYAAKKICLERGQECLPYSIAKLDGAEYHATSVMIVTCKLLGIPLIITRMVGEVTDDHCETTVSGIREVAQMGKYVLAGDTAYFPDLDPGFDLLPRNRAPENHPVFQPYFDLTKEKTIKFAKNLGILNDLMLVTHSCTEQSLGRCKKCYWCRERELAFNKLGIVDGGSA